MKVAMSPRLPLLVLLLVLVGCATEEPPVDEPLPSLVYRERDDGLEPERLVRVNADGSGRQVLVQGTAEDFAFETFAFSPDGSTLIYRASTSDRMSEDWFSIPAAGGTPAPFAAPFGNFVGWAPSGDRIAWLVWANNTIRLGVSAVGSADITLLSPDTLAASDASWSPDGTRLVFAAQSFSTGAPISSMYVVDLAGHVTPLSLGSGYDLSPSWSPTADRIAVLHGSEVLDSIGIWTVGPDNGRARHLTGMNYASRNQWSPDGSQLLAQRMSPNNVPLDVVRIDAVSGKVRQVFQLQRPGGVEANPWSPGGTRIVWPGVNSSGQPGIDTWNIDGTAQTQVVPDSVIGWQPVWIPLAPQ